MTLGDLLDWTFVQHRALVLGAIAGIAFLWILQWIGRRMQRAAGGIVDGRG